MPPPLYRPPPLPRNATPEMRRAHEAAMAEYRRESRNEQEFQEWMLAAFLVVMVVMLVGMAAMFFVAFGAKASIGALLVIGLAWVATYQVKQRL